jgi:hypothetical protein
MAFIQSEPYEHLIAIYLVGKKEILGYLRQQNLTEFLGVFLKLESLGFAVGLLIA